VCVISVPAIARARGVRVCDLRAREYKRTTWNQTEHYLAPSASIRPDCRVPTPQRHRRSVLSSTNARAAIGWPAAWGGGFSFLQCWRKQPRRVGGEDSTRTFNTRKREYFCPTIIIGDGHHLPRKLFRSKIDVLLCSVIQRGEAYSKQSGHTKILITILTIRYYGIRYFFQNACIYN